MYTPYKLYMCMYKLTSTSYHSECIYKHRVHTLQHKINKFSHTYIHTHTYTCRQGGVRVGFQVTVPPDQTSQVGTYTGVEHDWSNITSSEFRLEIKDASIVFLYVCTYSRIYIYIYIYIHIHIYIVLFIIDNKLPSHSWRRYLSFL